MQHARHAIDTGGVAQRDHGPLFHVGEQGDLAPGAGVHFMFGAAQQDVRLQADGAQFLDGMLGRLGLHLAGGGDVGHQGQVHEQRTLGADLNTQLARGFQEGLGFDVADGTTDLHQGHIHIPGALDDPALDLVRNVRDDLHGATEVVAPAFLADDFLVHPTTGEVVALTHGGADEALVMAQVEVRLGTVVGDEDLAVLEGAHGAGVHVDVGVELQDGHLEPARLEDGRQ